MKSKDKVKKRGRLSLRNMIIFFAGLIVLLYIVIFYNYFLNKGEVLAKEVDAEVSNVDVKISNATEINLEELIGNNTQKNSTEEYVTEEMDLEYITKYQSNPELPTGVIQVERRKRRKTRSNN